MSEEKKEIQFFNGPLGPMGFPIFNIDEKKPEHQIRCKDCGRVVCTSKMDDGWIDVNKQDAPQLEWVLVTDGKNVTLGSWDVSHYVGHLLKNITHWMPLPKPPIQ